MSSAILVAVVLPLLAVVSSSHAATLHAFQIGVLKDSPSQVIVAGKGFVTVHRPCSIRDFRWRIPRGHRGNDWEVPKSWVEQRRCREVLGSRAILL